jgi:hypothetical protein
MKTIAETDAYKYEVDELKNRALVKFKKDPAGSRDEEQAALDACQVLCDSLERGFSVLCDLRDMKATKAPDLFDMAQDMLIKAGVGKFAAIYAGRSFAKFQLATVTERRGMSVKVFFDMKKAEAWLDQD